MLHSHLCADSLVRVQGNHALQQIHPHFIQSVDVIFERDAFEPGEGRLEIGQFKGFVPVSFTRSTLDFEDFEDLIDFRVANEERLLLRHLSKDAASGPQVDAKRVLSLTEQDFRAAVPESHNLVSVSLDGQSKGTGQAEVSKLDFSSGRVNEQVLRLEVAMEDAAAVQVYQRLEDLVKEGLHLGGRKSSALVLQIFFKIEFKVLEDQVEGVFRVQHFFEPVWLLPCGYLLHDIGVLQPLQQ